MYVRGGQGRTAAERRGNNNYDDLKASSFRARRALIYPMEDVGVKVRLIDCVGFMVEGASGHVENEKERMVKAPWSQRNGQSRSPRRRKSVRKR